MGLNLSDVVQTMQLTLRDPRQAARVVMAWPLSRAELWLVLVLMAVTSTLLAETFLAVVPASDDPMMAAMAAGPLKFAALQFMGLVLLVLLALWGGRMAGGRGGFDQTMALVGWLQVIVASVQVAQILSAILFPPLALLIGVFSLGLTLWLMTNFAAELHGFSSLLKTFLGIVATMFGFILLLSLVLIVVFGVGA